MVCEFILAVFAVVITFLIALLRCGPHLQRKFDNYLKIIFDRKLLYFWNTAFVCVLVSKKRVASSYFCFVF